MTSTPRRTLILALAAGVVCLAGGSYWYKQRADRNFSDPRVLLSRFPAGDAAVLNADFTLLRNAGLLTASKAALEPDYRKFLEGTGFDYRRDLDSVTAAFTTSGNYFIARGHFDWKKLRGYVAVNGGSCYQDLCRIQGSTPDRRISFLPLRDDTIALAVSTDDLAATKLTRAGEPLTGALPDGPLWISVPGVALSRSDSLPPAMGSMLSALRSTERVVITFQSSGQMLEARLEATCKTPVDAGLLASQLRLATTSLREALAPDKINGDQLAIALTAGSFDQTDRRVIGKWPVPRDLLESLTAGI